jgi:hypothetical protein
MIGDETAQYYQLTKQADSLPEISFGWSVKTSYGKERVSYGGPTFGGWEYIGAFAYKYLPYFKTVQVYHFCYFIILIIFGYMSVKILFNSEEIALITVFLICTLPINLLFGLAFYQDLPVAALMVLCFYLLLKRFYIFAIIVFGLSFYIKETAILFLPAFCFLILVQEKWKKAYLYILIGFTCFFMLICIIGYDIIVYHYFYKQHSALVNTFLNIVFKIFPNLTDYLTFITTVSPPEVTSISKIASYPGDMRVPINWFIYFGGVFWVFVCISSFKSIKSIFSKCFDKKATSCLFIGLSYILVAVVICRNNPDVRYFLPGIPFT